MVRKFKIKGGTVGNDYSEKPLKTQPTKAFTEDDVFGLSDLRDGESIGKGIHVVMDSKYAILLVDLTGYHGVSSTGKSVTVAATEGYVALHSDMGLTLRLCRKT